MSIDKQNNILDGFPERLKTAIGKLATFRKKTGFSDQTIRTWTEKGQMPGIDKLAIICKITGRSADWLLFGKEAESPELSIQTTPRLQAFHKDFAYDNFIPVKLLRDPVAAGSPAIVRDEDVEGYCIIYADKAWMPGNPEDYTCCRVNGSSMSPVLEAGDIVAIDHSQKDPVQLDKKMVAFRDGEGVTIKWLKVLSDKKMIVGVPNNKDEFDSVVVLRDEEADNGIVGKVAWWWAKRK